MKVKGRPPTLLPDKEAMLVADCEMHAFAGQTRGVKALARRVTATINAIKEGEGKEPKFINKRSSLQRA